MKKVLSILCCIAFLTGMCPPLNLLAIETPKPVAYYNFNDANTLGYDLTGNGNTLEAFGSPTQTVNGKTGSGLLLDGHSSLYATTDTSGLDFVDKIDKAQGGSGQITIGYWLKTTKGDFLSPDWRRTVDNGSNGGLGYGGFSMLSLIDNIQSPNLYNPVINIDTADSSKISQGNWSTYAYTEEWHYLTWTFDAVNSVSAFYVNGTAIFYNDYTYTSKLSNANALFSIGAQTISAAFDNNMRLVQPFKGMIDELSVFDSVLTQDEISHYMVQGFSPDAGGEHQVYISTDSGCTATKTITDNVVTINAVPNDDYVLSTMYYITDGKQSARIENSSFIMPDDNVTVYVTSDNIKNPSYNNLFTSQKDATHYYQNKLLLVGGNAISEWKTSDDELLPMESVNLGINGITTAFCKNNIDAYKAFNPSAILINLGDDDITGKGFVSKTGTQTGELLKAYLTALKQNINVPIYFVSILPSRDSFRFSASSETVAANQIVKGFCESNEGFTYIDVSSKLLIEGTDTDGKPLATLFLDNGYTLSKKGYEIWTNTIRGALSISGEAPKNPSVNKSIYRFTGIDANLLAHYEFEDEKNPGKDSSYNKNDLSYYTMNEDLEYVKTTSAFPLTNSKEGFGKAASFDSYSFLSASNNKDKVDFTDKAKNLTISYLIKNRTLINDEVALANGWMVVLSNGGNYHNGWSLNCSFDNSSTSNNFSMFKKTTGEINIANPAAGTANATDWNRITFTIDNDTKTACAYINGTLFQKDISNLNYSMSEIISNFAIGAYVVSDEKGNQMILPSTFGFCGYLDDILVFDGALSAFQIAQIENINFTPPSLESGSNTLVNKNKLYVSDSSKTYTDLYKMYSFDDNTYIAFYNAEGSLITDLSSIITEGSIITAKRQNITVNRLAITRNPAGNAATSDEIILYAHLSVMIVMALIFLIFARKPSINQNNSI